VSPLPAHQTTHGSVGRWARARRIRSARTVRIIRQRTSPGVIERDFGVRNGQREDRRPRHKGAERDHARGNGLLRQCAVRRCAVRIGETPALAEDAHSCQRQLKIDQLPPCRTVISIQLPSTHSSLPGRVHHGRTIRSVSSCSYARVRSFYRELALRPSSSTPAESFPKLRICLPRGEGGLWFILVFPHQNVDSRVRLFSG